MLWVTCQRTLCLSAGHKNVLLCFLLEFYNLKFYIWMVNTRTNCHYLWGLSQRCFFFSFSIWITSVPAKFDVFTAFLLDRLGTFIKNHLAILWGSLSGLVVLFPMTYVPIPSLLPLYLDRCCFRIGFKLGWCDSSNFILFENYFRWL